MENYLLDNGIKMISSFDNKGQVYKYGYTERMFINNIFIEYYEIDYVPGEEVRDDGIERNETSVAIVMSFKKVAYHFMVLNEIKEQRYTTKQAVSIMEICRTIIGLVAIIENNPIEILIDLISEVSNDTFSSREFSDKPKLQKGFHDSVITKIATIRKIIEENRLGSN